MALKKITARDQSLLCASFNLNSFKRVIEELVYNSLDAESTSIAIRVCLQNNFIQVLDNGFGIGSNDFRLLGQKYVTSKFVDITTLKSRTDKYGFKGMSLASIIELTQTVKISSKHHSSEETWLKTFRNGRGEEFHITSSRPSRGTTVELSGFLYNLSIQQKSINVISELNNIKTALEQLSLVHCNVSLSLRDDSKNKIVFKIHKNRDIYQTLYSLFEIRRNDIQDLQVEKNLFKVKALIGKSNAISNKYQWIYLNGRIVLKSILHKKLNDTLCKILGLKRINKSKEKHMVLNENDYFDNKIPPYFLFISCPNFDFDVTYNHRETIIEFKKWDVVDKLFDKLVNFYCGNIDLKPFNIQKSIEPGNNKDTSSTRKKVKDIMDKILNNNDKKQKISQMQNGVKGKNIKRKIKKHIKDLSTDKKLLIKKPVEISTYKTKQSKNLMIDKEFNLNAKPKTTKFNANILKDKHHKTQYLRSANNKIAISEQKTMSNNTVKTKHSPKVADELIMNKFKNPTDSVKKRCDKLSSEVQNLLNAQFWNSGEQKDPLKNDDLKRVAFCIESNTFSYSNELYNTSASTLNEKRKASVEYNSIIKELKTSHDLLQTCENLRMCNAFLENKMSVLQQNMQSCYISCESTHTGLTFNSHVKSELLNKKCNKIYRWPNFSPFLSKSINKKRNKVNKIKNSTSMLKAKNLSKYNSQLINKLNLINKSSKNSINCNKDEEYLEISSNSNYSIPSTTKFNYEKTYTIDVLNSLHCTNNGVNKTYSVQMSTNLTVVNQTKTALPSVIDAEEYSMSPRENAKHKLLIVSESQSSEETKEPLEFCEVVFSNEIRDMEKEFEFSFADNAKEYSNLSSNLLAENEIGKMSQYFCDNQRKNNDKINLAASAVVISPKVSKEIQSSFNRPNCNAIENTNHFKIKSRHNFVPKGMSQIFENENFKNKYLYNTNEEYYEDDVYKNFAEDILDKFEIYEPRVKNIKDVISSDHKIDKDNRDLIFNSESLKHAKVLGQIDRKFIAAIITSQFPQNGTAFLALFDQHAVDERIALEENLSDYFNGDKWKSVPLETIALKLGEEDYFYLFNYKEKFSQFGLEWTFANKEIIIHGIPKAILGKNFRKTEIIFAAVKKLISEQTDAIKSLRGNVSLYPKSIMELVFTEACRNAIKFGDQLSKEDCVNMICSLARCKTPFQCAHGRPVMAIIMEIPNSLNNYTVDLNLVKKLKNNI